jgi:hypothetical protein
MSGNETGRSVGGEYYSNREVITPDSLLAQNHSKTAFEGRAARQRNKEAGKLFLVFECSDSRNISIDPEAESVVRAVDAAADFESFSPLLTDPSFMGVILVGHFLGKDLQKGKSPEGCGGRTVKRKLLEGATPQGDIEEWVQEHVADPDIILDLFHQSRKALLHTDKELLLLTRDQLDQTIYPVMAQLNEPVVPLSVDIHSSDRDQVYKYGLPHLTSDQLKGSVFEEFLDRYYSERFPRLWLDQTALMTQSPRVLFMTTDTTPVELILPALAETPGKVFVETIARARNPGDGQISISEKDITCAVKQADYPVSHFSNLSTIIVATENISQSDRIINHLKRKQRVQHWMQASGHNFISGQINNGVLEIARFASK